MAENPIREWGDEGLSEIRQKLTSKTIFLSMYVNLASIGIQGRVEKKLNGLG